MNRCALYRHFDEHGVLLYVGIADDVHARTRGHVVTSAWVQFASRGTVEWFETRGEAESAERLAIRSEGPVFNRAGATGDVPARIYAYKAGRVATTKALAQYTRRQARDELAERRGPLEGAYLLSEIAIQLTISTKTLTNARDRDPDFPEAIGVGSRGAKLYDFDAVNRWFLNRARAEA